MRVWLVSRSQTRRVLSKEPGDRHGTDRVGMALERGVGLAGFEVPDAQGLVIRAGNGAAAVGGDCHGTDPVGMALERGEGLAGFEVPDAHLF